MNKINAGKASVLALTATLGVSSLLLLNSFTQVLADSIWTTTSSCGAPQNANHYVAGEHIFIHGSGFTANHSYAWDITGQPNSGDPNTVVASGNHSTDAQGNDCFDAYIIQPGDSGEYKVNYANKNDNYRVDSSTPSPSASPSASPSPVASATPEASATPTATPVVCSADQHIDASGNCASYQFGGPSTNGGTPQGQVLGASTMAGTGTFAENLYMAIMGVGAFLTLKGVKNFKRDSKLA